MLSILLITTDFPFGDSETSFLETEYEVLKKNANVCVLAITKSTGTTKLKNIYKFEDYRPSLLTAIKQFSYKEIRKDIFLASKHTSFFCWLKRIRDIIAYSAHAEHVQSFIKEIVDAHNINIVYTYWCTPATLAALRIKESCNIPVITRFHGYDLYRERTKSNWQPLRYYISGNIDKMYFVCKRGMEYYTNLYGYPRKCDVAYLGTKKRKFLGVPDRKNEIVLLSCSSVIPLKRVELIAKTVYELSKKIKVKWYHIGGPIKSFKILDEANIKYNMLGQVPNEKIDEIYEKVKPDLFITLSSTEGSPISIQEAFSMGIPAIGTDVGGIPELIIENETGYTISMNANPIIVSDKIIKHMQLQYRDKIRISHNAYMLWENQCNAEKNAEMFLKKVISIKICAKRSID